MKNSSRSVRCVCTAALVGLGLCIGAKAQTATPAPVAQKDQETVVLSPFEVTTKKDRVYSASQSMGATRIALPTADISSSIVTLNEQVLSDRAAVSSMDVITLVSGVQRDSDGQPGAELYSLRGYATSGVNLRDGLPDPLAAADLPIGGDTSGYSRLEVIKGPAGVLYGSHSMGGVINKISKWPQFRAFTKVELQAQSSDEFIRGTLDSTGPLNDDVAYRVTLSGRQGHRYYDNGGPNDFYDQTFSLMRLLNKNQGKMWFRGEHINYKLDRDNGWQFLTGFLNPLDPTYSPVIDHGNYAIPRTANTVPGDDVSIGEAYALELGYENSFSGMMGGDWTLRVVGRFSDREGDKSPSYSQGRPVPVDASGAIVKYTNAAGASVNGDNRYISADDPRVADWRSTLVLRDFRGFNTAGNVTADMTGNFRTGILKHITVFTMGLGTGESARSFFFWNALNPANTTAVANSFSAVQPPPASVTAESIKASATKQYNAFNGHSESWGFNAAALDNISMFDDRLIASVGWRYDNVHSSSDKFSPALSLAADQPVIDPTLTSKDANSAWTGRYGLVGKPMKGVSVFGQISQTFTPVNGVNVLTGDKLPNRDGKNKEIGLKVDMMGGRLTGTASYFDMSLTNVTVPVVLPIDQGGGTYNLPVGSQNTFGWEFDLAAEPVAGLNLVASFSDITSRDERGNAFRGVPVKPNYSLMARYAFTSDNALHGLFVGTAWKHRGASPGDSTGSFYVGSGDQVDAFIGYGRDRWSIQCNIDNLTDNDAVWSSVTDQLAVRLQPRAFRLTFRYTF